MSLSAPSASACKSIRIHRTIRLGIVGCGHILRSIYSPILSNLGEQIRVTELCDSRPPALAEAQKAFPDAGTHRDLSCLLETGRVDALMILVSETAMASTAAPALRAGHPIFLEKPPVVSEQELDALLEAERNEPGTLYLAFNRRHTPLFQSYENSRMEGLRVVQGKMSRRERPIPGFPYTAIHLLDAVHHFSGQAFAEGEIIYGPEGHWRIHGNLSGGAEVKLEVVADGAEHCENIIFHHIDSHQELHFPNPESDCVSGRWVLARSGQPSELRESSAEDPLENMGYAACLRNFLDTLSLPSLPPSRLEEIRPTIRLMEAMASRRSRRFRFGV